MRPINKTTATLVRPHPFSTLCPTPLGNSPVCYWAAFAAKNINYEDTHRATNLEWILPRVDAFLLPPIQVPDEESPPVV